ncbi:CbtA family protein [Rhizobium sp. RAF56]|uniref:CbtA family protein n=1 Tax=Rhizobium sp. RAF56 TaxID=3233062 RepID=UPI003F9A2BFC
MVGRLLLRGMLVGVLAGLVVFFLARIFGEPLVDHAIAFEEQVALTAGEAPEPELVSRATQAGIGLFTAVIIYGAAIGGIFSLVFAYVHGRVSPFGPRATAALVALGAFVAIVLVPGIKYPANPPAVGNPDTIGARTELFFVMILISIAALSMSIALMRGLAARYGKWNAAILSGVAFLAVVALAQYLLPTVNEVPEQFSAVVLWQFRATTFAMHLALWTILGLGFGAWAERLLQSRPAKQPSGRMSATRG